jgi:hypothetical protein
VTALQKILSRAIRRENVPGSLKSQLFGTVPIKGSKKCTELAKKIPAILN